MFRGNLPQITSVLGQAISLRGGRSWKHPWQTTPAWIPGEGKWVAGVRPGFVNGRPPIVRTTLLEQKGNGRDFGINPLSGQRYFSSFVFNRGAGDPGKK